MFFARLNFLGKAAAFALALGLLFTVPVLAAQNLPEAGPNVVPDTVSDEELSQEEQSPMPEQVPTPSTGGNAGSQVTRLPAVQVTATRVERDLLTAPMSVSVVSAEDIRKQPAATVGGLLQDVPGVEIINSGANGLKRIMIRGESANRTLIMIDGQKIAENKSMDGTPLLIDPAAIERIEVIRGPASVLYGSEAIGGVVNIITRKGGDKPIQGEAGVVFTGSTKGFAENLSFYGGIDGFKYRLFGSYSDQGDYKSPDGRVNNTAFRAWNTSAFLSYDFEHLTLGAGMDYYDAMVKAGSQQDGYENFAVDMPRWRRDKYYAFAEFSDLTGFLPKLRFDAFYQRNDKHMINHVDVAGMPMVIDNDANNKNRQFGFSLQTDWEIGDNHYLITGYEYNRDMIKAVTTQFRNPYTSRFTQVTGLNPTTMPGMMVAAGMYLDAIGHHKGNMQTHAIFGQMESKLPLDFIVNYGARQTWVRTNMSRAQGQATTRTVAVAPPPPSVVDTLGPYDVGGTGSTSDSKPVFNLGVVWNGIDNLALRAQFAQGFRAPNLQERYFYSAMGGGNIIPNPNLDPETSNNYEFGVRYNADALTLDGAFFYSDADDYIGSRTIGAGTNTIQYINVGKAKTFGVELAASYDLPLGFTPYVSGTWMRRKYDFGTYTTYRTGTPAVRGRLGLRYTRDVNENVTFYADLYGRYSSYLEEGNNLRVTNRCNSWKTANLALGMDFGPEKEYSVGLEILNIGDKRYYLAQDNPEPGTSVNARFSFRF